MSERRVWEEELWGRTPYPRRSWSTNREAEAGSRSFVVEGEPLWPWARLGLAPLDLERSWEIVPGRESMWVHRNGRIRHALVDYAAGVIVEWRREGLASRWQPPPPRPARLPGDDDEGGTRATPRRRRRS